MLTIRKAQYKSTDINSVAPTLSFPQPTVVKVIIINENHSVNAFFLY